MMYRCKVLKDDFLIKVDSYINNITNTVYQTLEYYAMPGRNFNLSLRFHLK